MALKCLLSAIYFVICGCSISVIGGSPIEIDAKVGEEVRFNCTTKCKESWTFTPNSIGRKAPAVARVDLLQLKNVSYDDAGYYQCDNCSYSLVVQGVPMNDTTASHLFWCKMYDHSCDIFNSCPVWGNPKPRVLFWNRLDAKERHIKTDVQLMRNSEWYQKCAAVKLQSYQCTANNSMGSVTVNVWIFMEESDALLLPKVLINVTSVPEGSDVTLEVHSDAPHETVYVWLKDGLNASLLNSNRILIPPVRMPYLNNANTAVKQNLRVLTLEIHNVTSSSEGNYTCLATWKRKNVFTSTMLSIAVEKERKQTFAIHAVAQIVTVILLFIAMFITLKFCLSHRRKLRRKELNKIQACFKYQFYVSSSLAMVDGKVECTSTCRLFFEKILLPVFRDLHCNWSSVDLPTDGPPGFQAGENMDDARRKLILESWKMIVLLDDGDMSVDDDSNWQQFEINTFTTSLVDLEEARLHIEPSLIMITLNQSERVCRNRRLDFGGSCFPVHMEASDFSKQAALTTRKVKAAISGLEKIRPFESEYVWDVFVSCSEVDKTLAEQIICHIKRRRKKWKVHFVAQPSNSMTPFYLRRSVAYSQVVVMIFSDKYLKEVWPQMTWTFDLFTLNKILPIVSKNFEQDPNSSLVLNEIKSRVTCLEEGTGDQFFLQVLLDVCALRDDRLKSSFDKSECKSDVAMRPLLEAVSMEDAHTSDS
eukprot:m.126576 g.126576  ORF g.126576 m.126576 type:complete len:704 (+) comp37907_c0_seq5:142-2253(+)